MEIISPLGIAIIVIVATAGLLTWWIEWQERRERKD